MSPSYGCRSVDGPCSGCTQNPKYTKSRLVTENARVRLLLTPQPCTSACHMLACMLWPGTHFEPLQCSALTAYQVQFAPLSGYDCVVGTPASPSRVVASRITSDNLLALPWKASISCVHRPHSDASFPSVRAYTQHRTPRRTLLARSRRGVPP
jgi:hypothetical protein